MKSISYYSPLESFIVASISAILVVMLFRFLAKKFKSQQKESLEKLNATEVEIDLSNYILDFKMILVDSKSISFTFKIILIMLSPSIIFIPLYEFIKNSR
ncbi:hypothetical protein OAE03_00275 [Winogradskyella sp.]|nr:hypothetical protein [Winogradskyella sp.]MDC0007306.1 hypothetical protein [Winogradskyella sp.]MDC0008972.1 hypothetical protein [Winogradskyella sp.]MDC1504417.1 hypothetical protein [Winogradskyella sp.]